MIRSSLLAFCVFIQLCAAAQGTLQFCDHKDDTGNPENTFESLILSPEGQTIYLLYASTNGPLSTPQIKMEIARLINYSFQKTDQQSIFIEPTKEKLSIPFHLKEAGDYRFRLTDAKGNLLAEEILSVSVEMTEPDNHRESGASAKDQELPDHADLQFSNGIDDDFNSEFSFSKTRGKIQLTLEPFDENDPVKILDIWQNENGVYKLFIRSEKATFVKSGDKGIYLLSFPAMKDYKVDLHNMENTLITSGFVSLK